MSAITNTQDGRLMSLGQIAPGLFAPEYEGLMISGLCSDSRKIQPDNLFVALKGYTRPGTEFVIDAIESGAVAVVSDVPDIEAMDLSVPKAYSQELAGNLSLMAGEFYAHPSHTMDVIGITGTNGKTSCCFWLGWLLNQLGTPSGQIGTLGATTVGVSEARETGFTTPDAIQTQELLADCAAANAEAVVMEVSSHGLDQGRAAAVKFETAIFTNLTQDHLDYHGSMENYLQAKMRLFQHEHLKRAVLNLDDAASDQMRSALAPQAQAYSYSLENTEADLYLTRIEPLPNGFFVEFSGRWGEADTFVPVLGKYNLANLLAVTLCLLARGEPLSSVVALLEGLPQVPGRMQQVRVASSTAPVVVVDYAHTPDAVRASLETLKAQCDGNLIVVLGCGGDRDKDKRAHMARTAIQHSDSQIFTSDNPRNEAPEEILKDMVSALNESGSYQVIEDRREAIGQAVKTAGVGDLVAVLGKGHENYQLVKGERLPFSDVKVSQEFLQDKVSLQEGPGS